ncbi:MAG: hypothetical protein AAGF11_36825 [Myxococcota bacterium]
MSKSSKNCGVLVVAVLGLASCGKGGGSRAPSAPIPETAVASVTFAEDSGSTKDVRQECGLQSKIPEWIADNIEGVRPNATAEGGRMLTLEITHIDGAGGGAWTGPKRIAMTGMLTENGEIIGSFRAQRTSGGGMWGGYKGTCSILETCGEELGEDVADWLRAPSEGAELGELGDD